MFVALWLSNDRLTHLQFLDSWLANFVPLVLNLCTCFIIAKWFSILQCTSFPYLNWYNEIFFFFFFVLFFFFKIQIFYVSLGRILWILFILKMLMQARIVSIDNTNILIVIRTVMIHFLLQVPSKMSFFARVAIWR